MKFLLPILTLTAALTSSLLAASPRIVTAGGGITEIVYALGAEKNLVATDTSSTYPEAAKTLPQIGYSRALSAEGIVSLTPTLLITTTEAGPPAVIQQIRDSGIQLLQLNAEHTPEAVQKRITDIASALQADPAPLLAALDRDLQQAAAKVQASPTKPRVLFIYTRGGGSLSVSGKGTAADAMIALAGGINAVTGYDGYKPLTAEAAVTASPDVILLTSSGLDGTGGIDALLKSPGLALTPAGKNRRVFAMDDLYLLGFGPRLGQAVLELTDKLHSTQDVAKE